ncbi:PTS sugar transporter subunit IIA [Desulfobacula sp.]|uniref:PTS sugar transporter subunit IIA n=1 Tax=Desulfobacula sp. TaxID=2593537 RepID=UPI002627D9A1|nr:PTS sugar transporter subunit IIA [Desulfobacula sp.]
MQYSVFELSKHLGVVPDTIERWVRQGKLPVSRTGKNYQFRISELKKWAATHNICLNLSDEDPAEKKRESIISLSSAVKNGGIYFDIIGDDVTSVLRACIKKMSIIHDDFKKDLFDRLVEREQALSTGIGNGIAIPHPREQLSYLNDPAVSIFFLADPVDYNALDHQPVSVLFFILCPALKMHLQLLSALSFCLRDAQFKRFLNARPDPHQLIEKIEILQTANPI